MHSFFALPNARGEAPPAAGARHERTLEGVASSAMWSALRLARPVPVQSHFPALQFGLPPTFHCADIGGCRRCSCNLQNRNLIVAWVPTF